MIGPQSKALKVSTTITLHENTADHHPADSFFAVTYIKHIFQGMLQITSYKNRYAFYRNKRVCYFIYINLFCL